jgi:hypothetical protein
MAIEITNDSIVKILIRRGQDYERQLTILTEGELGYTIDTQRLFVGDGVSLGGKAASNFFLGRTSDRNAYSTLAEVGDTVYETTDTRLYAWNGTAWDDIHPIPDNISVIKNSSNNYNWGVANSFGGEGFNITYTYSNANAGNRISNLGLGTVEFDSRYLSLSAAYSSFYFGNVRNKRVTNNLDARVNIDNSLYVNSNTTSGQQIQIHGYHPTLSTTTIRSTSGRFVIQGKNTLSLGTNLLGRDSEHIILSATNTTLNTVFSSTRRGNADGLFTVPDFDFFGFPRFRDSAYVDNNLTIAGNLSVYGDATYIETLVTVTSSLSIINFSSDIAPALYVKEANAATEQPIAVFDSTLVNPSLIIRDGPLVGINIDRNLTYASTFGSNYVFALSGGLFAKGRTSSNDHIDIHSGDGGHLFLRGGTGGTVLSSAQAGNSFLIQVNTGTATDNVTISGGLRISQDVVAYATSDVTLKKNIKKIASPLEKITKISGVNFEWNDEAPFYGKDVGVIAQEIEAIMPEIVTTRDNGTKAVRYEKIIPLLIEAIKELNNKQK